MSRQIDRQIVAMSAGRATMERREDPIHEYILGLSPEARPRVGFLPTASGDDPAYTVAFYETYHADRCIPTHLNLFYRQVRDVHAFLMNQDVIHVGGETLRICFRCGGCTGLTSAFGQRGRPA